MIHREGIIETCRESTDQEENHWDIDKDDDYLEDDGMDFFDNDTQFIVKGYYEHRLQKTPFETVFYSYPS